MARQGGNSGPEGADGINWSGNGGGLSREYGIGNKKTVLDHDPIPSKARAKASCGDEYYPNSGWYSDPPSRQEKK